MGESARACTWPQVTADSPPPAMQATGANTSVGFHQQSPRGLVTGRALCAAAAGSKEAPSKAGPRPRSPRSAGHRGPGHATGSWPGTGAAPHEGGTETPLEPAAASSAERQRRGAGSAPSGRCVGPAGPHSGHPPTPGKPRSRPVRHGPRQDPAAPVHRPGRRWVVMRSVRRDSVGCGHASIRTTVHFKHQDVTHPSRSY